MDSVRTTLVFEQKPDGWIGYAPEVTGAYVQGSTLDEVRAKLRKLSTSHHIPTTSKPTMQPPETPSLSVSETLLCRYWARSKAGHRQRRSNQR